MNIKLLARRKCGSVEKTKERELGDMGFSARAKGHGHVNLKELIV